MYINRFSGGWKTTEIDSLDQSRKRSGRRMRRRRRRNKRRRSRARRRRSRGRLEVTEAHPNADRSQTILQSIYVRDSIDRMGLAEVPISIDRREGEVKEEWEERERENEGERNKKDTKADRQTGQETATLGRICRSKKPRNMLLCWNRDVFREKDLERSRYVEIWNDEGVMEAE